jgi:MFS family permease
MGIALSMISGGDVALLWDSYLAACGEKARGAGVLGNATLAAQMGTTVSALLGGAVVTLSYGHLLWANAILSWIPVLLVLCIAEPPASYERPKKWAQNLKEILSATVVRDTTTRLVFLNMVVWGSGALLMFWVNQTYWQETAVPLPWFGILLAGYNLIDGCAAKSAALGATRYGRRPLLAVVGVLPIVAYLGMASFFGWGGILFGFLSKIGRGVLGVLFMEALTSGSPPSP